MTVDARARVRRIGAPVAPAATAAVDWTPVRAALQGRRIQRKVTVGPADDAYEREADRVAARVAATPSLPSPSHDHDPRHNQGPAAQAPDDVVRRQVDDEGAALEAVLPAEDAPTELTPIPVDTTHVPAAESGGDAGPVTPIPPLEVPEEPGVTEDELLEMAGEPAIVGTVDEARDSDAEPDPAPEAAPVVRRKAIAMESPLPTPLLEPLRVPSGGTPLPLHVARRAGAELHADFSSVRVHDTQADRETAARLSARAFTLGAHIWLGPDERADDVRLMAHELTHVVQQRAVPVAAPRGPPAAVPEHPAIDARAPPAGVVQRDVRAWIPDALLEGLASRADRVPGFRLLAFAVGSNPITGAPVARNARTLLEALEPVLPTRLVEQLRETQALERAFDWFRRKLDALDITPRSMLDLLRRAWDEMRIVDGLQENWDRLKRIFGPAIGRITTFVRTVGSKLLEFVLEAAVTAIGGAGGQVWAYLSRVRDVIGVIAANPIDFVRNLVSAGVGGVTLFFRNIGRHLRKGFAEWLSGTMSDAGVTLPARWDLRGVITLGMQLIGLTYQNFRRRLARALNPDGERKVSMVERGIAVVRRFAEDGPGAVVPMILDKVSDLLTQVTNGIVEFVVTRIGMEVASYLSGLFTGGIGTIVKVAQKIYQVVTWVIEQFSRMRAIVDRIVSAIEPIARGALRPASESIEATLAGFVPLLISLFARLLGLGDLPQRIRTLVQRLSRPVDRGMDRVVAFVVRGARALLERARAAARQALAWFRTRLPVRAGDETHTLYFEGNPKRPKVMLASTPRELGQWLDEAARDAATGARPARDRRAEVEAKLAELNTAIAQASPQSEGSSKQVAERLAALKVAIEAFLRHVEDPAALPVTRIDDSLYPKTHAITVGGTSVVVGGKMTVAPLTAAGPRGSDVDNDSELWKVLRRRRKGAGSHWIQGHLLNNNLHGPGNDPRNLTPISREANAQHEQQVESLVKRAVQRVGPDDKGRQPVVSYEVEAKYDEVGPAPDASVTESARETMDAERYLASRLVCTAAYVQESTPGTWTEVPDGRIVSGVEIRNRPLPGPFEPDADSAGPFSLDEDNAADQLATVPGLPTEIYASAAVRQRIIDAARGKREWADFEQEVVEKLEGQAPNPSAAASLIHTTLRSHGVVLFRRARTGGAVGN